MTADSNHDAAFDPAAFMALAVGNTRARFGLVQHTTVHDPAPLDAAHDVLLASVNPPAADALADHLESAHGLDVHRFGKDLPIPIALALDDASTVGQDRLLCALAAYSKAKQACIVIDAGTAITIDFVDGQGIFQGGVIAPGLRMMLASLHHHTASLPALDLMKPDDARGAFGKDTKHAMLLGVRNAAIGLARYTAERYAEAYEAYPQIIATGGDAAMLFDNDGVVEHIVPDLQLQGIAEAAALLLKPDAHADDED
jgi:type III pantothenate kinase